MMPTTLIIGKRIETFLPWILRLSLSVCCAASLPAQAPNYHFDLQIINVENGLPNRRVYDIVQDQDGFIWISTPGMISRFDGYQFKTYTSKALGIHDRNPCYLAVDAQNRLWYTEAGTPSNTYPAHSGILDLQRDSLLTIEEATGGKLSSSELRYLRPNALHPGQLLVSTQGGTIYRIGQTIEKLYQYPYPSDYVIKCFEKADSTLLVFQQPYSLLYDLRTGQSQLLSAPVEDFQDWHPDTTLFLPYPYEQVWQIKGTELTPFRIPTAPSTPVQNLLYQSEEVTLVGMDKKILIYNSRGDTLSHFSNFEQAGFYHRIVHHGSYFDHQKILWIGTEDGLFKLTRIDPPFELLEKDNSIRGITIYQDQLLIGGYARNVQRDLRSGNSQEILDQPFMTLLSFEHTEEGLWAGTTSPFLFQYLPEEKKWKAHQQIGNTVNNLQLPFQNPITGNLWVGTINGLVWMNPQTQTLEDKALPTSNIGLEIRQFLYEDSCIWIVTNKGLFEMDAATEMVKKEYSAATDFPFTNLNFLHIDATGSFWLGTRDEGLVYWDRSTNKFQTFTTEQGLSDNTIYAIYEDSYQYFWLPSKNGLMRFHKKQHTSEVFLPQHGTAHQEFNTYAHFQGPDSSLYFGGLNGITHLHPNDFLSLSSSQAPLVLTEITAHKQKGNVHRSLLSDYQNKRLITFQPDDVVLELKLALLDFHLPEQNEFIYRIETIDSRWIYAKDHVISLYRLPYGSHRLCIKARPALGHWPTQNSLSLELYVPRPIYFQWWFFLLMACFFLLLLYLFFRYRTHQFQQEKQRLETEVQKRTAKIEEDRQTIARQAAALQQLDEAKNRFFANVTHEFRTPLTLVLGPLQQVLQQPDLPTDWKTKLTNAYSNADHLQNLIDQLLDLSKLEEGKMTLEISQGDLAAYTESLIRPFLSLAEQKGITLQWNINPQEWPASFDFSKWGSTVQNLLSNAVKFTPEGGLIQIQLTKQVIEGQPGLCLTVRDNGSGMSASDLTHIFDRFYQTGQPEKGHAEGTGIGLALVKELVEFLNGKITVESTPGQGSRFQILLPLTELAPAPDALPGKQGNAWQQPALVGQLLDEPIDILLIEDKAAMRQFIISCLSSIPCRILEASNGQMGIEMAVQEVPDLIISDVKMPFKDGLQVTKTLREHKLTGHIPIILLTAHANQESKLLGIRFGADVYLTKPFNPEELRLWVQKLIENRKYLQQRFQPGIEASFSSDLNVEGALLQEVRQYVLDHISDDQINGMVIGKHIGISRMQLHRKLKAMTNLSTSDFIKRIRLEKASLLLAEKKLTIAEIAYQTGFTSPSQFSKSFKKLYGKSPRAFR